MVGPFCIRLEPNKQNKFEHECECPVNEVRVSPWQGGNAKDGNENRYND
jgi:hypothetical protein